MVDTGTRDKFNADNDLYLPPSDSFWEPGKYSRVVRRCDDGNKLTSDLIAMITERAALEKAFSKMLKGWSKQWSEYLAKSPEFGSTASAWRAIMAEADASAEVHQTVHDELQNDVVPAVKSWQKAKYIKSMMHIKSTKDFEEEFRRAQKPWAKLYDKVDKYKREYHSATKGLKMAETQENNAKLDGSITQEQRSKIQEKLDRSRKEKEATKSKYTEALQELNRNNPKYMDDMNEVFTRCQTFERDRLVHFREFLEATEKCLDLRSKLQTPVFNQFSQTIKNCDADKDLSWWSDTYGATMKMNWPIFEEPTNLVQHCQQPFQHNRFSYSGDLPLAYDACHRRPLAHFVSQTSAAVLVVDSYATIRRSMRRTAAVVTRVRRDLAKREEYSDTNRTIARPKKGDVERENPVVVTGIRSSNNPSLHSVPSSDTHSSINYVNQSPVPPIRSNNPSIYPTLTTPNNANPFGDDDDDHHHEIDHKNSSSSSSNKQTTNNRSGHGGTTSNGGNGSLPPYPTNTASAPYPASANPFLDDEDDDNVDALPSAHQSSYKSPSSTGGSSLDTSGGGVPVRALYDYEAQEQDELSFKQGDVFTKLEDEDDQGWCKGRVNGRVGLYPATYVESL